MVAEATQYLQSQNLSAHTSIRSNLTQAALSDTVFMSTIPTADFILTNPRIPLIGNDAGGEIRNPNTQRTEGIPLRHCNGGCGIIFALPRELWSVVRKVGLEREYDNEMVKVACVHALQNAYNNLPVCKAEVYCFEECVMMVLLKIRGFGGKF